MITLGVIDPGGADKRAHNPASMVLPKERLMWLKHLGEVEHSPQPRVQFGAKELRIAVRSPPPPPATGHNSSRRPGRPGSLSVPVLSTCARKPKYPARGGPTHRRAV